MSIRYSYVKHLKKTLKLKHYRYIKTDFIFFPSLHYALRLMFFLIESCAYEIYVNNFRWNVGKRGLGVETGIIVISPTFIILNCKWHVSIIIYLNIFFYWPQGVFDFFFLYFFFVFLFTIYSKHSASCFNLYISLWTFRRHAWTHASIQAI
jgi:hypothetical protein